MSLKFPDSIEHNNPDLPITDSNKLQGGWQEVPDLAGRNAIPEAKRKIGMSVTWLDTEWVTKRFQGPDVTDPEWTNDVNWSEFGGGGSVEPVTVILANNSNGSFIIADHTQQESFVLYYRADRGANDFQSGQISIDYKNGAVHFIEFIGKLLLLGVTIDVNINGNNIEIDWIVDDNVNDVNFVYTIGNLAGSAAQGGSGDMTKVVYDPNTVEGDAFDMENMAEGANNKILTGTERAKINSLSPGAPIYDYRVKGLNRWHSGIQIGGGTATQSTPDGALIAIPFPVANAVTLSKIAIENTSNVGGSSFRLGIYASNANNLPGALVLDCGSVPTIVNAIQELTINQALSTGLYWLVAIREDVAANVTLRSIESGEAIHVFGYPVGIGAESGGNYISKVHVWSGSWPDPFPTVVDADIVNGNANTPLIFVNID